MSYISTIRTYLLLALVVFICHQASSDGNQKLEVKIYYEALCPDSMQFITNQLRPFITGKGHFDDATLDFVPYGHVMSYRDPDSGEKILQCQHGRKECELNALHACIIENYTPQESYNMITCMMSGFHTKPYKCAEQYGLDIKTAKNCKEGRSVPDILEVYGNDTDSINPSFIPTITFEGVYDWDEQRDILKNFDKVFCAKYESKFNTTLSGC